MAALAKNLADERAAENVHPAVTTEAAGDVDPAEVERLAQRYMDDFVSGKVSAVRLAAQSVAGAWFKRGALTEILGAMPAQVSLDGERTAGSSCPWRSWRSCSRNWTCCC